MSLVAWLVPLLGAVVLHEFAHAEAARQLGDDTAARAGRCTINPFAHLTWYGLKPVPVDYYSLGAKRGLYVALAGPAANLLQAGAWAALGLLWPSETVTAGVLVNTVMCVANLLPIEPLDGWRAMRCARWL